MLDNFWLEICKKVVEKKKQEVVEITAVVAVRIYVLLRNSPLVEFNFNYL
jgi:hypothetical protein